MAQFNFTLNGKNVTVTATATSWRRSGSWGHEAKLFINDELVNTSSIRYYNRTWESYQYKTVLHSVVNGYLQNIMERDLCDYKRRNHLERLPRGARKEHVKYYSDIYNSMCAQIDARDGRYSGGWTF